MNVSESHGLLPSVVGFTISAALLWIGAEAFAAARARAGSAMRRLQGCALVLAGCGVWWPGHFAGVADDAGFTLLGFSVGGLLAWTLAGVAFLTAVAATRRTLPAFAGLAVATLLLAYGHSVFATPALFRAVAPLGPWGPPLSVFVLATTLVGLGLEFRPSRKLVFMRIAAAATCGGVLRDDEPVRRPVQSPPTVDSLTQLPTRLYFEDRLAAAATKADANSSRLALLFIDLDGFKPVNDTYGHSIGDLVLEQVGQRLKAMSRGKDVVARVGGDEFLLLLTNVQSQEAVAHVANRLIQGLSAPYAAEGREVMISCSVGIATYPDGCSHAKLIARADAAMYASKRSGGSTHCFYSSAMDADAEAQFELLRDLRKAVGAKQFELLYQPKIDTKSGKVTAVEALLRWKHPTRGTLLPSTFIPIAERFGLIGL